MSTYRSAAGIVAAMLAVGASTAGCGDVLTLKEDPIVEVDRSSPRNDLVGEDTVEKPDGGLDASGVGETTGEPKDGQDGQDGEDGQPGQPGAKVPCEETDTCPRF